MASSEFRELLRKASARFPSKKAFAEALDIDPSRLTRALNAGDFPFNVTNCLRLAKISGESPGEILRAAGKKDVADLIESLYGRDRNLLLTASEKELLDMWNAMTPRAQESLRSLIEDLSPHKPKAAKQRTA